MQRIPPEADQGGAATSLVGGTEQGVSTDRKAIKNGSKFDDESIDRKRSWLYDINVLKYMNMIKRKILISSSVNFSVNVSLNVPRVGDSNLDVSGRYYESISESIQAVVG